MEDTLIREIDSQPWIVDYDRKLQYYGYRNELEFHYVLVKYLIALPKLINELATEIFHTKTFEISA